LLGVLGAFLLLACANDATLLLARSTARAKELAVRAALGATRGRILRQLLAETSLLALGGGAAALALTLFLEPSLMTLVPANLSGQLGLSGLRLDPRVLGFTLAISLLAALAAGLAPALHASRPALAAVLRDGGGAGRSAAAQRPLRALVVGQIALAFTLLTGAGLVIEDFRLLARSELGFQAGGLWMARIELPPERYAGAAERLAFAGKLRRGAEAIPGVEAAGLTSVNPLAGATWSASAIALGQEEGATQDVNHRLITPGLLAAMRIPLLRGRDVSDADAAGAERVVIVSRHLAFRLWPGGAAVGKKIRSARPGAPWMTVVAIAGDVRDQGDLADTWYLPWAQNAGSGAAATIHLMRAGAVALFAAFGLLLAALGTYGVVSFTMAQRTAEIGLRLALGAEQASIQRLVLGQTLLLACAGVGSGLVAALALHGVLRSRLVEVQGAHPLLYAAVALLLLLVALAAAALPARRASAIEPAEALRAS
jgi:predicted permease